MNNMINQFLPGAGPFHYKGNHIGILMIPGGGGGTCADLKPLAEDIYKENKFTIHIPLLPGFGTKPEDLRRVTIDIWKRALIKEYNTLKETCSTIIVGGHSMGGIFSLLLAAQFKVNGIFIISTPIGIRGIGVKLVPIIKPFMKYHKIPSEKFKEETNGEWVGYDKIPLNVLKKTKLLLKELKAILPEIKSPILIFQGKKDTQINKESMEEIYKRINSIKKRKVWLENNDHSILNCPDHLQIVKELNKFIRDIAL